MVAGGGSGTVIISYPNGTLNTSVSGAGNTHVVGATDTIDTFIVSGNWSYTVASVNNASFLLQMI
jgi:hypothetical protein